MPRMTGKSTTEVLARASGRTSGTHGHLHDIYKGSVYYFHHKKHADYIQYTPTEVKKKVHYASTANSQYKRYCLLNI